MLQRSSNRAHRARLLMIMSMLALVPTDAGATDPLDVWYGENIDLERLTISVDGQTDTTSGLILHKPPYTLDITLPLSQIGLPTSETAPASGTAYGNTIVWTFDKPLAIDLGGWDDINRVHGWIQVEVVPLPWIVGLSCAISQACYRSNEIQLVDSDVWIEGDTYFGQQWAEPVDIQALEANGGLPMPHLGSLYGPLYALADFDSAQSVTITGWLTSIAPSGGATIQIESSAGPGSGFSIPSSVTIGPGSTQVAIPVTIAAGFTGNVELSFKSKGSQMIRTYKVKGPSSKKAGPKWGDLKRLLEDWVTECPWCPVEMIDPLGGLTQLEGLAYWIHGEEPYAIEHDEVYEMSVADAASGAWITGTGWSPEGHEVGFVAQMQQGTVALMDTFDLVTESGEGLMPAKVDASGNVAGHIVDAIGLPIAAVRPLGSSEIHDLGVPAEGSVVQAMNRTGFIVGTTLEGDGFVAYGGSFANFIPSDRSGAVIPTSVNARGQVAGHFETRAGRRAMLVEEDGSPHLIEGLDPEVESWAQGITSEGWVLGNVVAGEERSAFIRTEEGVAIDFDAMLELEDGLHVLEVVQVSEDDMVVLRAIGEDGAEGLYTLQL